ncbi:MAG: S-layer homology domain-containing protein [Anaerovoracaceae bacterium]|nr:S-layer homology domain-containing protein [Bacillota bacterium]MDY2670784.1 S-layer homology domain-containing protein [Anaerovoracaceae bacterium]
MKKAKRSIRAALAVAVALAMLMSLMPMAFAGELRSDGYYYFTDRDGTELKAPQNAFATSVIDYQPGDPWTSVELNKDPKYALGLPYDDEDISYTLGVGGNITLGFDIGIYDGPGLDVYVFEVGGAVEATEVEVSNDLRTWYDIGTAKGKTAGLDLKGKVPENARFRYIRLTDLKSSPSGRWPGADIQGVSGLNITTASDWSLKEIDPEIIPDNLPDDWTQPITREEFAAVSVKAYEKLSGTKAIPDVTDPFTDCKDPEVLKAYNVGITAGTSDTTFSPYLLLNREQAASMLTRVFKRVSMNGWTLKNDAAYPLHYTMPAPFRDDAQISGWARDSVYFMAANNIIVGNENHYFMPRNVTSAQEADHYANATIEQALAIASRMVNNLG